MTWWLHVVLGSGNILDCHFCEACGNSRQMPLRCMSLSDYVLVGWHFWNLFEMLHFVALGLIWHTTRY